MGAEGHHGAEHKIPQQEDFPSMEVGCNSATGGNGSQAEKGEVGRNHRRKQARLKKAHGKMQRFQVDGEVKDQRQRK